MSYIADKKIKDTKEAGYATPQGTPIIEVEYEGGAVERMSHIRYELIVTDKKSDLNEVREKLTKRLGAMIYSIMIEYDLKLDEIDPVLNTAADMVNGASREAANQLFGVSHSDERSLVMINKILWDKHGDKSDDGSPSAGDGTSGENQD